MEVQHDQIERFFVLLRALKGFTSDESESCGKPVLLENHIENLELERIVVGDENVVTLFRLLGLVRNLVNQ